MNSLRKFGPQLGVRLTVALVFMAMTSLVVGCGEDEVGGNDSTEGEYSVGGTVEGLEGEGLVLQLNGENDLVVDADGEFAFSASLFDGDSYEVSVHEVPERHECDIENASGTIDGASVGDVNITCEHTEDGDPAHFAVAIDEAGSELEVEAGEIARVVADIENLGDERGTQDIELTIDGSTVDTTQLDLGAGEVETITLEWETVVGDAGIYDAQIRSDDDSDTVTVVVDDPDVDAPAHFAVSIDETASTVDVEEGEDVIVEFTIENLGDDTGTQDIELQIDGEVEDTAADVELDGGATQTLTLQWSTAIGDAGSLTAQVVSEDDSDMVSVNVSEFLEPAYFAVSIDTAQSTLHVEEGETVVLEAEIENTGDETATQDIVLEIGGQLEDSVSAVELDGGDSQTVTLEWQTVVGDAGSHTAQVASDDDSDTATVDVDEFLEPAFFAVSIDTAQSTLDVEEGETVVVEAEIENTGDETATQDITVEIDGQIQDTVAGVELDGGASQTVTLQWDTAIGDAGAYVAEVESSDDSDSASVNVSAFVAPAFFAVTIDTAQSTLDVDEGETVVVEAEIENTGDETATQDITLEIDGQLEDTAAGVELAGGASQTVTLQWDTTGSGPGNYTAEVASNDDSDTVNVSVDEDLAPAFFAVTIDTAQSTLDVDEGELVIVEATVENTGDETATQDITLEIDGQIEDTVAGVELAGGASQTVTLEWQTAQGDEGAYVATVGSDNDSDSASVNVAAVLDPAFFAVTIDETQSTLNVDEGEMVVVEAQIENTGDETDTQDIMLEIGSFVEDTAFDIELAGGATQTVTLQWQTAPGDAGTYDAEVISADDSDLTSVTVNQPAATDATLSGVIEEDVTGPASFMEGVEVLLLEVGTDTIVDSDIANAAGEYEFIGVDPDDYDLMLQAPGLEPNYEISEAGGSNILTVTLSAGANTQDLTVDWKSEIDLMIDGGMLVFQYDTADELVLELPGCEEQADGSWELVEEDNGDDDFEIYYDPEECFQINGIGVDLATGAFDVDTNDILFPDIEIFIDDSDDEIDPMVNYVEADFDWLFDDISGEVDYTTGRLDVDIDFRILIGGTANVTVFITLDIDFGARDGENDCQLTSAWGGDVDNPQTDDDDEQIGDYLHDTLQLRLTTGDSGPFGLSGVPYDAGQALAITIDNELEIGRLSEGSDPGGASCGEESGEDFAVLLNDLLGLPAFSGDFLGETDFLVTE